MTRAASPLARARATAAETRSAGAAEGAALVTAASAPAAAAAGLKLVYLLAPTSNPARIAAAAKAATGFVYFVSVTGVTGAGASVPAEIQPIVAAVRQATPLPGVIGFGVSTPEQARALAPLADGVVVGSAIVKKIAEGGAKAARAQRVARFVRSLKKALRPR